MRPGQWTLNDVQQLRSPGACFRPGPTAAVEGKEQAGNQVGKGEGGGDAGSCLGLNFTARKRGAESR